MQQPTPEKKEAGYFSSFQSSWKKVWEFKTLWLWGALMALSSGYSFSSEEKKSNEMKWEDFSEEKMGQIWGSSLAWLSENFSLAVLIFLGGLVMVSLFLIISSFVRSGLIRFLALKKEKKTWRENGKEIWKEGKKSFGRLLRLDLFFGFSLLAFLLLGTLFLGSASLGVFFLKIVFWQRLLGFILFLGWLIFLLIFLFSLLAKSLADFLVVLLEKKSKEALWEGGMILRKKTKEFVKLWGMLFLGTWLAVWVSDLGIFFFQAFLSGVNLVFQETLYFNSQQLLFFLPIWSLLTAGLLNIFKLDYQLWWLEKNKIIKPLKEKKEEELEQENLLVDKLEVPEGINALGTEEKEPV